MKKKLLTACLFLALALPSAWAQTWYTGDGGKDIRLAVGLPSGRNLAKADAWLTEFVQGSLIGDFQKYSAMTVIDRQNVEKIIAEQKLSETGFYEEKNYAQVGQLTSAQYLLTGSITKQPKGGFSLQLGIADVEKGTRRASFNKLCTEAALNNATVLKEAAFELLAQMGVSLTAEGKEALYGVKSGAVEAETALSKALSAQKNGTVVEALSYFYQAVSYDPSQAEAAGRLNVLSGTVAGGSIGQNVRNDIQQREAWLKVMNEAAAFFKDHKPYEIVYDPALTGGKTNYQSKTVELSFKMILWPTAAFGAVDKILAGLEGTGKKGAWGLGGWPLGGEGAVDLGGRFTVEAALLNARGRTLAVGRREVLSQVGKDPSNIHVRGSYDSETITFTAKAADITDALTVKITKIDGRDAAAAGRAGYIQISAAGTEYKIGDTGPAGGIIFFTMGGSGWRYLEAAPEDLPDAQWGAYGKYIGGTEERPGSGKKNTDLILAAQNELGERGGAAQLCAGYELNGYRDWFLPSKDELYLMYANLNKKGLGNFRVGHYWSSTEYYRAVGYQNFDSAAQLSISKDSVLCVRAIRAF
jgi:hypothetical protein